MQSFAERLRHYRRDLEMTQEHLALISGVSLGCIRMLEQGMRKPRLETAVKLARALCVTMASLTGA